MKKKVAILIYYLASGGAERQVSIIIKELKEKFDITLILMNDTIFYEIPKDIKIIYLEKSVPFESGIKKLLKLPILGWKYKKILKKNNIDISLSFMTRPNYINIFAKLYGSKIKTIISERSYFSLQYSYNNLQSFINKKLVKLYNFADFIITNSTGNAEDLIENFNISTTKIDTIYNIVDIKKINLLQKEKIAIKKEKFTFVTIGRLDRGKNHQLLIKAIKEIDANLWIIGEGELKKKLELLIENLKLKDKVKLLGRQNNPYKFLNKADCFVFASNHEGFPNVLLEALACKLPIISTDCKSGPREILAPNTDFTKQTKEIELAEYGILTPVGDVEKMAKAMKMVIKNKNLGENYLKKAINRVKDFEVKKIMKEWEETIEN